MHEKPTTLCLLIKVSKKAFFIKIMGNLDTLAYVGKSCYLQLQAFSFIPNMENVTLTVILLSLMIILLMIFTSHLYVWVHSVKQYFK